MKDMVKIFPSNWDGEEQSLFNWFDTLEQETKATHLNSISFGCWWSLEGLIHVMSNPNMYCIGLLCLFDLYSVWPQTLLNLELIVCSYKLGNMFRLLSHTFVSL